MGPLKKIPRPYLYLLIVSLVAMVVFWLEGPGQEKSGDVLNRPLFDHFDFAAVARIEIEHLLNGVQLEKKGGAWQVAAMRSQLKKELDKQDQKDPPPEAWEQANAEKIDLTFSILRDVVLTSLAGTNSERHGTFEVNKAGMQVRFFDAQGAKLAHLYIGKAGPAFTESYVRREGEDEVYLANRYLRSTFSIEAADWRKKAEEKAAAEGKGAPKEAGNK